MRIKGITRLIASLLPVFFLSGCWSATEISNLSIVMGVALEKTEKNKTGLITQIVIPENVGLGSGDGKSNGEPYINIYTDCDFIAEGMERAGNQSDKKIYLPHNAILLFSDGIAKDGIYPQLDYFMRTNELRMNVMLFVTENSIKEIMDVKSESFQIPATYIASLGEALRQNSDGVNTRILDFIDGMLKKSNGNLVPIVTVDETSEPKCLKVAGTAVFKDDKMAGKLSLNETRGILWLNGKINRGEITATVGKNALSAQINSAQTKRTLYIGPDDRISVRADITAELFIKRDTEGYITSRNISEVKDAFAQEIRSEINAALDKMKKMGIDVYGFAHDLYRKDFRAWGRIENSWDKEYKELYVDINTDISLRETGSINRSILKERDREV